MTSVGYTTVALIHLGGVLAFQQTGIAWILLIPVAHAAFATFIFVFAVSALLGTSHEKIKFEPEKDHIGIRFLSQFASLLTAYQVYLLGYGLLAGIMIMTAICLILTLVYIAAEKEA